PSTARRSRLHYWLVGQLRKQSARPLFCDHQKKAETTGKGRKAVGRDSARDRQRPRKRVRQIMLRWFFRKTRTEEEIDAEIRSYIEHAVDEKTASGLTPDESRRAALIEFGGVEQVKEHVRTSRSGAGIVAAIADCRYALRALHRRPSFAAIAILTIAL